MAGIDEPIAPLGPRIEPYTLIQALRWLGDLTSDELIAAFQAAANCDLETYWPELDAGDIDEVRRQCRAVTKSRLRAWSGNNPRRPTWLELRGLISGLHQIID